MNPNFFLVPGFLLGFSNRIYAKISGVTEKQSEYIFPLLLFLVAFWLFSRTLLLPVWRYFNRYYYGKICAFSVILAVCSIFWVEKHIPLPSFTLAINKQSFCEQYVKIRHKKEIESGQYNYFRSVDHCLAAYDKLIQ